MCLGEADCFHGILAAAVVVGVVVGGRTRKSIKRMCKESLLSSGWKLKAGMFPVMVYRLCVGYLEVTAFFRLVWFGFV